MQQELDFHGFVWKDDVPVVRAIKNSSVLLLKLAKATPGSQS
jgi:hypothetical protein